MNTKLPLLICILFLTAVGVHARNTSTPDSSAWKVYTVKNEEFSVALPALPALHMSSNFIEAVQKQRRYLLLGAYAEGVAYVVYMQENPGPRLSLSDFIAHRTGSGYKWNLTDARNVNRNGFSGKEFVSANPTDGLIQYFATEDRLFEFRAFGAPPEDLRLEKFFSSVSFGETKGAVTVKEDWERPLKNVAQTSVAENETSEKVYTGKEVDRKIRLAMQPEPSYTEAARKKSITGTVLLKCVFSADGNIRNITVVSGLPYGLTENAIAVARKIKFIPGVKDGKFVSTWMQVEYNFNLY